MSWPCSLGGRRDSRQRVRVEQGMQVPGHVAPLENLWEPRGAGAVGRADTGTRERGRALFMKSQHSLQPKELVWGGGGGTGGQRKDKTREGGWTGRGQGWQQGHQCEGYCCDLETR